MYKLYNCLLDVELRLKAHYKKIFLMEKGGRTYNKEFITCKYFVAVDFEATCIEENGHVNHF